MLAVRYQHFVCRKILCRKWRKCPVASVASPRDKSNGLRKNGPQIMGFYKPSH